MARGVVGGRFIGVEKHTDLAQVEYWILSEYCDNGSLCDYLKSHLVSWPEALRITEGVARGLAHLHEVTAAPARPLTTRHPPPTSSAGRCNLGGAGRDVMGQTGNGSALKGA